VKMPVTAKNAIALFLTGGLAGTLLAANAAPPKSTVKPSRSALRSQVVVESTPPIDFEGTRIDEYELVDLPLPQDIPASYDATFEFEGETYSLGLDRFSNRSADFAVYVDYGDGQLIDTPMPPARTYVGLIEEIAGSEVSASILENGVHAMVHLGDDEITIQPAGDFGIPGPAGRHIIYRSSRSFAEGQCGNGRFDLPKADLGFELPGGNPGDPLGGGVAGIGLNLIDLSIECDFEFFQRNSNSVTATVNDVELIINNCETIYRRDVGIAHDINTVVVRADANDPYTSTTIGGRLDQFRANWQNAPENDILRDTAQMFSGVNFAGGTIGLAWLGSICGTYGYSVVESLYTNNLTYRTSLSAHEMGHNWNSGHCDSSSGCHIMCSGNGGCDGISGTNLKFGNSAQNAIISYLSSRPCDIVLADPIVLPFRDDFEGTTSDDEWISNNGTSVTTAAMNEPGGIRSLNLDATGSGEFADDEIRTNYIELSVPVAFLSYWTQHRGVEAGESLFVDYLENDGDWVNIETHVSDGVDQTGFDFHQFELPSSARYNGCRIRIRTDVDEPDDDWYVDDFTIEEEEQSSIPNDDCDTAIVVLGGDNPFTTIGSTDSGIDDSLNCSTSSGPSVSKDAWFEFTAFCTGPLTLSTCEGTSFDTRMSIYDADTGCPSSGDSPFACNDDSCGTGSFISTFAFTGQTFLIRIGSSDGSTGDGTLRIECGGQGGPENDECDSPDAVVEGSNLISTAGATSSGIDDLVGCSTSSGPTVNADLWYVYDVGCTGLVEISTCGAEFDTRISVYDAAGGCPSSGDSAYACNDDACGSGSLVTFPAFEGQSFLIRVGSSDGSTGSTDLAIVCTPFGNPCPEDLNSDGIVNGADLGLLLGAWGTDGGDINGDGLTNGADLGLMLGAWGDC
jgi:hypothetical protein